MESFICTLRTVLAAAAANASAGKVTFSKDAARLLTARCVECHHAGEFVPTSFTSFQEVHPYAKDFEDAVLSRRMPPWLADPHFGQFSNERRPESTTAVIFPPVALLVSRLCATEAVSQLRWRSENSFTRIRL